MGLVLAKVLSRLIIPQRFCICIRHASAAGTICPSPPIIYLRFLARAFKVAALHELDELSPGQGFFVLYLD